MQNIPYFLLGYATHMQKHRHTLEQLSTESTHTYDAFYIYNNSNKHQ